MEQRGYQPQFSEDTSGRYRSVSVTAVISLIFGCVSIISFLSWTWCLLPIIGMVSGWLALVRIHEIPQELTGAAYAKAGIIVSAIFLLGGSGYHLFRAVSEVPWGYEAVDYDELQPEPHQSVSDVAKELSGQRVFIRGYMEDSNRRNIGLTKFIICPVKGHCNFCTPNPTRTEMIRIELTGNMRTDYTTDLVRIGGLFKVDEAHPSGVPYFIEADYLK